MNQEIQMNTTKREALKLASASGLYGALLAVGLLKPGIASAQAFNLAAFQAKTMADALKALGVSSAPDAKEIQITAADIAENGAVVPVGVRSTLPKTEMLALLVDKNPNALAGVYEILEGAEADVSMRIKMSQSSEVLALVKADGKFYSARREIKVTLGGCGG
jgi:sulfur-oxidizing protein SoxY